MAPGGQARTPARHSKGANSEHGFAPFRGLSHSHGQPCGSQSGVEDWAGVCVSGEEADQDNESIQQLPSLDFRWLAVVDAMGGPKSDLRSPATSV